MQSKAMERAAEMLRDHIRSISVWSPSNAQAATMAEMVALTILSPDDEAPFVFSDADVDALALHLCGSENTSPTGTQVRFLDDGMHSVTFLEIAKRRVRVVLNRACEMRSEQCKSL